MDTTNDGQDARSASRIVLRPVGSPLPLGMAELAGTSVMLTGDQLGWLPLFASAVLLVPAVAASFGKVTASAAFALAAARFALTGIYHYQGGPAWEHASGWTGLALCLVALYNEGGEPAQVRNVEYEVGVREQL